MAEFGSITSFAKMYSYNSIFFGDKNKKLYSIKPKLHGTFGKIIIEDGKVKFFSKNRHLTKEMDNAGFFNAHESIQQDIINRFSKEGSKIGIYGEWCGKGIHKSTDAICQMENKKYCVFAVSVDDMMYSNTDEWNYDIVSLGWTPISAKEKIFINFEATVDQTPTVKKLNEMVAETAVKDEWARINFGVEGTGEGFVGVLANPCTTEEYFKYAFKAKTEAHRVRVLKDAVSLADPMPLDNIQFLDEFCTAARVRQAVHETSSLYDMSDTPKILSWVAKDIQKEGQDEMNSLGMEWKKIAKQVNQRVINIWKGLVNEESNRNLAGSNDTLPATTESSS